MSISGEDRLEAFLRHQQEESVKQGGVPRSTQADFRGLYDQALKKGWRFYLPEELGKIFTGLEGADEPCGIWANGALDLAACRQPVIAVVGARRAGPYGIAVAEQLCRDLVRLGVTVASGLAYGVDTASHSVALDSNGWTIAVLGTGLDVFYPPRRILLFHAFELL